MECPNACGTYDLIKEGICLHQLRRSDGDDNDKDWRNR